MNTETRVTLDKNIRKLTGEITELASMVEEAIQGSVAVLMEQDLKQAKHIYHQDKHINEKRYEIEKQALITVATQQPMATDLRILASIIDLAGELERIGDYAKGIARIAIRLGSQAPLKPHSAIPEMARLTAGMQQRAIQAFTDRDEEAALSIPESDDQIDRLYNQVYRDLLDLMIRDQNTIDRATFFLWVAHNLERAADRVTNICERTIFTTSGRLVEFDRTDDESKAI